MPIQPEPYFDVMPAARAEGAKLIRAYAAATGAEAGLRSVDALQETARPGRFVAVETWDSPASFESHQTNAATRHFHEALQRIQHSPYDERVHRGFSVSPPTSGGAVYVVTHVDVVPPQRAATEAALRDLVAASRRDPGTLRYDVLQQTARANHFTLYAVWRTLADFEAHERSAHRLRFRETLAPLLGALYDERLFTRLR